MIIETEPSVNLNLSQQAFNAWTTAKEVARDMDAFRIRLTSGWRPRGPGEKFSFHNVGMAIDFVVEGISQPQFDYKYKLDIGPNYDVVSNNHGTGPHTHAEYDPRG